MATCNGERFLAQQLDSILSQSYADWTLYVRDDLSDDGTLSVLRDYANRDSRICIVPSGGSRLGAQDNFLSLLASVESHYYMFADQDDVWFADKIDKSLSALQRAESSVDASLTPLFVFTDLKVTDQKLNVINDSFWNTIGFDPKVFCSYEMQAYIGYVTGCTMLFNRVVRNISLPRAQYSPMHDWWIACQVYRNGGQAIAVTEPTMFYRKHSSNVTGQLVTSQQGKSFLRRLREMCVQYRLMRDAGVSNSFVGYLKLKYQVKRLLKQK